MHIFDEAELRSFHRELLDSPARHVGEFHLKIVYAANLKDRQEHTIGDKYEAINTPVGNIRDFRDIDWWINGREKNLRELKAKTTDVLASAQNLKEDAQLIHDKDIIDYEQLVHILTNFSLKHERDFTKLGNYAVWLENRDLLAPAILFAYQVWGSTNIGERQMLWINTSSQKSDNIIVDMATEIAFGLVKSGELQYFSTRSELDSDWAGSHDPSEYYYYNGPNPERVSRETCKRVLQQFVDYFENVRDSLRTIRDTAEAAIRRGNQRIDPEFWTKFVMDHLTNDSSESEFFDFKKNLPIWVPHTKDKEKDAEEFGQDIASFANSNGGALIIGVSDSPPWTVSSISPNEDQKNKIAEILGRITNFPFPLLEFNSIRLTNGMYKGNKIIVILIPQTSAVIRVKLTNGGYVYPQRGLQGKIRVDEERIKEAKKNVSTDNFDFFYRLSHYQNPNDFTSPL